jgi:Tubulin like
MNNHFIIGLGGTGGKIIREFRKALMQQYRTLEPDGVCLGYLYVDSDVGMMGPTDPEWRTLGHNVQLPKSSQLEIGAADLSPVLSNVNAYPGVKDWIGDKSFWSGVLTTQSGATILGGQKRRLGRFLFSQKSEEFVKRAQAVAYELQQRGTDKRVTFHVCCGLAGGTGSGSVVDAISQIRSHYESSANFPIFIYALLPDQTPPDGWDTGNYHANGYGALVELNALHVGALKPHDVTGSTGERRLALRDAFNTCYVFSNQNENNAFIDVKAQVPQVIASFLSAAILTAPGERLDGFRRVVTAENLHDKITPEPRPDGTGEERSRKFGIFGIKLLSYPEQEIREYLTYSFARQAALQLATNNWRDQVGFVEESLPQDFAEFVRSPETQDKWKYSIEHLTLSRGILDGEITNTRWRPITTFWTALGPQWLTAVTANEATRTNWMPELKAKFEEMFTVGYRGQGVREFYRGKLKAKREHAEEIRRTVERELFDAWIARDRSLGDISRLLTAFLNFLHDLSDKVARLEADDRAKAEATDQRIKANDAEWGKCGPLARTFNKDKNILHAQATVLQDRYAALTRLEGAQFAKPLLMEVIGRIEDLGNEIATARKTVDDALINCTAQMRTRCAQPTDFDLAKLVVTFYDTNRVRKLSSLLEQNKDEQDLQTRDVRVAIKSKIAAGDEVTFVKFNERIHLDALVQLFETACEVSVDRAHTNFVSSGGGGTRLLGVNVVDKLYDQFNGRPDELIEFVHDLMAKAGRYGSFDQNEQRQSGKGIATGAAPADFAVLLPTSPAQPEFREHLAGLFKGASGNTIVQVFESSPERKNEITLISVAAGFPLRFLSDVRFLRDRYERRLAYDDRARVEVHLEGDGTQHPSLFLPKPEDVEREMREYLLIAEALELVKHRASGPSSKNRLVHVLYDEDGDECGSIELGSDLFDAARKAKLEDASRLRKEVEKKLNRDFKTDEGRVVLREVLRARVNEMKSALDRNDAEVRDQLTAALQGAKARLQVQELS